MRVSEVRDLMNGDMLPLVMSFACDAGAYGAYDECFAEAWFGRDNQGGAIGVLAASEDSYWEEDDVLERAVFDALFESPGRPLGDVVLAAKE